MTTRSLSTTLLSLGVLVGAAAAIAMAAGFEPAPESGFLVKVALYKLTFIASAGLLMAGAIAGRWARSGGRQPHHGAALSQPESQRTPIDLENPATPLELPLGEEAPVGVPARPTPEPRSNDARRVT